MEKGTSIEMLTPKEMLKAVSLSISSHRPRMRESENARIARDPAQGATFLHPNGARRLTGMRVIASSPDALPPSASYVADHGHIKFEVGKRWLLEVTLDNGKQRTTKDPQPALPLIVHY